MLYRFVYCSLIEDIKRCEQGKGVSCMGCSHVLLGRTFVFSLASSYIKT